MQYSIDHQPQSIQEDLNQQRLNDECIKSYNEIIESRNELLKSLGEMLREQVANLSTHTPEPSRRFNFIYDDDEDSTILLNEIISQIPPSIVITPVLLTMEPEDSLNMGDKHLSTIPEKESDEVIKSSVEDLAPIPKDIESKKSYVSNIDEQALLVTHLSKLNEDECFDPRGDEIEACLTSDSILPGIDGADFDPKGDILLIEKLLNDDISIPLLPKELHFEGLKVIKSYILPDFEDDYYDSEGVIIYLEGLLIKDTTHNLPPEVFLDHDPKSLKDQPDNDDLKSMVKIFDPGIHEKIISPTYNSPEVPERTTVETISTMSPKNKDHYESEKEAIHLILTGIGDEIYSTVDACKIAHEIWFYKLMNEMIRNNLTVDKMQVNIQFLQLLQPEWSRFVTIVKQQHKLDEVSYHKFFDILKQYQKKVNELCAERIDKNANPLALVATAQTHQDPYYQTSKSHKSFAPTSKASLPTKAHATIRQKGKEIAKPITPPPESASDEDSDPEQAQKDKEMQKNLALFAKYFKKLYKPTSNNLRTSSNTRNKNVDITPSVSTTRNLVTLLRNVGIEQSDWLADMDEEIDEQELEAHYNYMAKIQEVPNADSSIDSEPLEQNDQNAVECDNERVTLANLIANLKLDVDENKKKTSRTLGESNSIRDSCLVALQNKQTEFERYKAFNDRTDDYKKLERKLNETLGLLAQKDIDIKEGLKLKAYEISVVQEKHDELVKQSLLSKSHYEGLVKEKTKVITDLKLKEEKDIDKMISMENQLKFLNEIVYKRSQSIQTIHMLAPKCPTFNGRPTFANPMYLKKAQYEKPCLYEIPHDQSDPANRLVPDREEILTLEEESRSKLNKDLVKPFDYTKLNSLYEIFKPPTQEYQIQLAHANEIRKKIWRTSFVNTKPNIFKNIAFLLVSKSISKSRQAYNVMTNNINHLREIVDQAWVKHSKDHFRAPTAKDMEILIKTCLMPLALKTQNDSFAFVHELKKEMHADLKYVESLENEIDELESDKAEFSNMYDMLLQECVSNDVMCSYLHSLSDLDEHTELQCL
ncbi:hypothetical protein Tco_0735092 [Tanacetum coccineum]